MRRRGILVQIAVLALVAIPLASAAASAAPTAQYNEAAVVHAFRTVNIKLKGRPAGNHSQPVTAFTAVVPATVTHKKPWAVQVWVYGDADTASQAYTVGIPAWRDNGIATAHVENLIVTVVPKGVTIGSTAPAFAMPQLVTRALHALQQSH